MVGRTLNLEAETILDVVTLDAAATGPILFVEVQALSLNRPAIEIELILSGRADHNNKDATAIDDLKLTLFAG